MAAGIAIAGRAASLLNLLVRRVIRRESEAVPAGGQHDVDVVGIVEGHGRAVQRCFVERPSPRVRVHITLAILPGSREPAARGASLGAPIIRKSGKVTGTRLGRRRYRPRLRPPRRRRKCQALLTYPGSGLLYMLPIGKAGDVMPTFGGATGRVYCKGLARAGPVEVYGDNSQHRRIQR